MTVKKIYIQIDESGKNYDSRSDFGFEVFFITEYISKDVAKKKLKFEDVNKLVIYIESPEKGVVHDRMFRSLDYKSLLSYKNIDSLKGSKRTEKLLELIEEASSVYNEYIPGIQAVIHESIQSFSLNNYRNIWSFKKRRIPGVGFAELICELNRDNFILTMVVRDKVEEKYRKVLLKTKPDSLCYHHKFKDIVITENNISVVDRFDKIFFQMPIDFSN